MEPENRIVVRTLEQRWNEQLEALERVKRETEQALQAPTLLSDAYSRPRRPPIPVKAATPG